MLLPSALPCDGMVSAQRPQRPKLLSFSAYAPPQHDTYTGGLLASCRALHTILGGSPLQSYTPPVPSTTCAKSSPFATKKLSSPSRIITPPRGFNKRSRDEYEQDEHEKENIPQSPRDRDLYQTPKRRRRIPQDMPLGLNALDFAALNTPIPTIARREGDENIEMPPLTVERRPHSPVDEHLDSLRISQIQTQSRRRSSARSHKSSHPPDTDNELPSENPHEQWSPLDDRRLVEVVLSKLSLSKREWNDCAKQLGKDKDSLGRRWRMLIGEGNIGLRRGLGRHARGDLDIKSW